MRLLVIGDPERKKQDYVIIKAARKLFTDVLYVPITDIMLETGGRLPKRILYKNEDITNYECSIPIPTLKYFDLFVAVVNVLRGNTYLPYTTEKMIMLQKRFVTIAFLREFGIRSDNFYYSISPDVFEKTRFTFPLEVLIGDKRLVVDKKINLKGILSLRKSGEGIFIMPHSKTCIDEYLVMGKTLVGGLRRKKKYSRIKPTKKVRQTIRKIIKLVGVDYFSVKMKKNDVVSLSLCPEFFEFRRVLKKDVATPLLDYIIKKKHQDMTVFDNIIDFIRRYI